MDSLILEKDNSENQARQYSGDKHVANTDGELTMRRRRNAQRWFLRTQYSHSWTATCRATRFTAAVIVYHRSVVAGTHAVL